MSGIAQKILAAFRVMLAEVFPDAEVLEKMDDASGENSFFVIDTVIQGDEMEESTGASNGVFRVITDISSYTNFHEDRDRSELNAIVEGVEGIIFDHDFLNTANQSSDVVSFYAVETGQSEPSVSGGHNRSTQELTLWIGAKSL